MPPADPATSKPQRGEFRPVAAVAAWVLPGLGHWLIGDRPRAIILFVAIGGLYIGGLLIGGISVIDYQTHRWWFLGQACNAVTFPLEYVHNRLDDQVRYRVSPNRTGNQRGLESTPLPGDSPLYYTPSYSWAHEQGVLYTALAGLLNLLAIIDVVIADPKRLAARYGDKLSGEPAS